MCPAKVDLAQGRSSQNSCAWGDYEQGGRREWRSTNERGRRHFGIIKHFFFFNLLESQELGIFGNQPWSEGYQFRPIIYSGRYWGWKSHLLWLSHCSQTRAWQHLSLSSGFPNRLHWSGPCAWVGYGGEAGASFSDLAVKSKSFSARATPKSTLCRQRPLWWARLPGLNVPQLRPLSFPQKLLHAQLAFNKNWMNEEVSALYSRH